MNIMDIFDINWVSIMMDNDMSIAIFPLSLYIEQLFRTNSLEEKMTTENRWILKETSLPTQILAKKCNLVCSDCISYLSESDIPSFVIIINLFPFTSEASLI